MSSDWQSFFSKTWLGWPGFDKDDHEVCPILDKRDADSKGFSLESPHIPFGEEDVDRETLSRIPCWSCGEGLLEPVGPEEWGGVKPWEWSL